MTSMDSWKLLLLQLLIIGLVTSGFTKPADPKDTSVGDYQDDDAEYDDNDSEQKDSSDLSNSVVRPTANNGPAYFRMPSYTETAKSGGQVTLRCDVENPSQNTLVIWYKVKSNNKNDRTILYQSQFRATNDDRFILNENDHSITIAAVKEEDESLYECNVLPDNITMSAKLKVLTVLTAHIYIDDRDVSDRSITFRQGDTITVDCKASGLHAEKVDFKWSSNGNRLTSDDHIKIDGGHLVISNADRDHVRVYQCLADNGADGTGHASVTINIQYVPHVTAHKSIVNTKEGDSAELHCNFESSTESKVIWRKDKKPLQIDSVRDHRSKYSTVFKDQPKSNQNSSVLLINRVNEKDLGDYECIVQNNMGKENVTITLTYVPEPPHLHRTEKEGEEVITHWHIRSYQPLTEVMLNYQLKDTKNWLTESPIDHEQSKEHSGLWKIKHKLALSPGHWHVRVKAKNAVGWSTYSTLESIEVGKSTNSAMTVISSSSAIWFTSIISLYLINFSSRLFG